MRFGVHCRLWTTGWTNADLHLLDHAKELGFSALEISMGNLDNIDPPSIRARAEKAGIEIIGAMALGKDHALATPDREMRRRSIEYLKAAAQALREMGGRLFGGMFYAVPGRFSGRAPSSDELSWIAEGIQEVAVFARGCDVALAIEPVNRYETYLLNTAAQAQALIDRIGEPNVGLLLDTYHMNIEERGIPATILRHSAHLRHLHLNESDRGMLGSGNIDWSAIFVALKQIGYRGIGSIEVFGAPSPQAPAITPIWRQLFASPDQLARDSLEFLSHHSTKDLSE